MYILSLFFALFYLISFLVEVTDMLTENIDISYDLVGKADVPSSSILCLVLWHIWVYQMN